MIKDKIIMVIYVVWMVVIGVAYMLFLKAINKKVTDEMVNQGCTNIYELMAKYQKRQKNQ